VISISITAVFPKKTRSIFSRIREAKAAMDKGSLMDHPPGIRIHYIMGKDQRKRQDIEKTPKGDNTQHILPQHRLRLFSVTECRG
jgi:hypothetical protein